MSNDLTKLEVYKALEKLVTDRGWKITNPNPTVESYYSPQWRIIGNCLWWEFRGAVYAVVDDSKKSYLFCSEGSIELGEYVVDYRR